MEMDICEMGDPVLIQANKGRRYIIFAYEQFAKFVCAIATKTKLATNTIRFLQQIREDYPFYTLATLVTDMGGEFSGHKLKLYEKNNDIYHSYVYSEMKSTGVERLIRTWRSAVTRMMMELNTRDWSSSFLQQFVNNYNHRTHTTTRQKPFDVFSNGNDSPAAFAAFIASKRRDVKKIIAIPKKSQELPSSLDVGKYVKIARLKNIFEKESSFQPNYTEEIFRVSSIERNQRIPYYNLEDLQEKPILGSFYKELLVPFQFDPNAEFIIEKILKKKKEKDGWWYLVRWRGYRKEFDSWVNAKQMSNNVNMESEDDEDINDNDSDDNNNNQGRTVHPNYLQRRRPKTVDN